MSLYALIRNSYDPVSNVFNLSASDIELEGHLDGNLCRCTGYKPILSAAKTFILEDLKGKLAEPDIDEKINKNTDVSGLAIQYRSEVIPKDLLQKSAVSCGRPGGCCKDTLGEKSSCASEDSPQETSTDSPGSTSEDETSLSSQSVEGETDVTGTEYGKPIKSRVRSPPNFEEGEGTKTTTNLEVPPPSREVGALKIDFIPYIPSTELIFPPALWKFERSPICYGNKNKIWLSPTTVDQVLAIKDLDPSSTSDFGIGIAVSSAMSKT